MILKVFMKSWGFRSVYQTRIEVIIPLTSGRSSGRDSSSASYCVARFINIMTVIKIGQLVPEDRERLLQSTSPREILQLFVKWKEGKVSFDIEGDVIKFSVSHVGQYKFQETPSCERPKRLRRAEIIEKIDALSLKVLEDMVKKGIFGL